MAKVFPPEVMLDLLPLPFSVKEQARQRMAQLEQQTMQLEAAKAHKPPALSADLGDLDKLPPEAKAQLLQMFGIQVDPQSLMTPDPEMMKKQIELQGHAEKTKMDLQKQAASNDLEAQKKQIEFIAQSLKVQLDLQALQARNKAKQDAMGQKGV
jgi:hypothetical protein